MPYYPPSTGGGGTPEPTPTPDLQAVVDQGGVVAGDGKSIAMQATGGTAYFTGNGVSVLKGDGAGQVASGIGFDGVKVTYMVGNDSTTLSSSGAGDLLLPAESGTLALRSEVQEVADEITVIDGLIDTLQGQVGTLTTDYGALKTDYDALLLRVAALETA